MVFERIQDRTRGRWRGILSGLGVETRFLTGKHTGCPLCNQGKDRYRFDDKGGDGTWICNACGSGNGVDFVMRLRGVEFADAKTIIEQHIGSAPVIVPKAEGRDDVHREKMAALWSRAEPLTGEDIASRYLRSRGIEMAAWPKYLRWLPDLPYYDDAGASVLHPAMLAKYAAPDGKSGILHRTYLAEPGVKADVPKPRMLMPGKVPAGGAVRLAAAAETMGIAEGIETALSASLLFGIPVWSALTAGAVIKWEPPPEAKCVLIFGEHDRNFAGQHAAYSLAYRLKNDAKTKHLAVEVKVPDLDGADWNDVHVAQLDMERAA